MTPAEREKAIALLNRSRQTLRDAVAGIGHEEATWKPAPDRWSVIEYVEHLSVSDDHLVGIVKSALAKPATPETAEERAAREDRMRNTRGTNRAPEAIAPRGHSATLAQAMAAFEEARARTLEFASTIDGDLRSHFETHALFGPMDAYQWLLANARHVEGHAAHIRAVREAWQMKNQQKPA